MRDFYMLFFFRESVKIKIKVEIQVTNEVETSMTYSKLEKACTSVIIAKKQVSISKKVKIITGVKTHEGKSRLSLVLRKIRVNIGLCEFIKHSHSKKHN